jgi:hypothetical protein
MAESFFPLKGEGISVRSTEVPMNPHLETQTRKILGDAAPTTCTPGRIIDDVLTTRGQRTGQVRCLECGKTRGVALSFR